MPEYIGADGIPFTADVGSMDTHSGFVHQVGTSKQIYEGSILGSSPPAAAQWSSSDTGSSRSADTPGAQTASSGASSPHAFAGFQSARIYNQPHDLSALVPPADAPSAKIGFPSLIENLMCFGRKGTIAFLGLMGLAEINNSAGKSTSVVLNEMRQSIPIVYSSIATPMVGNDNWGHNLLYGIPNRTAHTPEESSHTNNSHKPRLKSGVHVKRNISPSL